MVFEVGVEEFEIVPDFTGLVVAAVGFAFEDGDIRLYGFCQSRDFEQKHLD